MSSVVIDAGGGDSLGVSNASLGVKLWEAASRDSKANLRAFSSCSAFSVSRSRASNASARNASARDNSTTGGNGGGSGSAAALQSGRCGFGRAPEKVDVVGRCLSLSSAISFGTHCVMEISDASKLPPVGSGTAGKEDPLRNTSNRGVGFPIKAVAVILSALRGVACVSRSDGLPLFLRLDAPFLRGAPAALAAATEAATATAAAALAGMLLGDGPVRRVVPTRGVVGPSCARGD
jgi:hypothetical protein